jgi:hypothetical protein
VTVFVSTSLPCCDVVQGARFRGHTDGTVQSWTFSLQKCVFFIKYPALDIFVIATENGNYRKLLLLAPTLCLFRNMSPIVSVRSLSDIKAPYKYPDGSRQLVNEAYSCFSAPTPYLLFIPPCPFAHLNIMYLHVFVLREKTTLITLVHKVLFFKVFFRNRECIKLFATTTLQKCSTSVCHQP